MLVRPVRKGHSGCRVEGPGGSAAPLRLRRLWARPAFSLDPRITQAWGSPLPSIAGL